MRRRGRTLITLALMIGGAGCAKAPPWDPPSLEIETPADWTAGPFAPGDSTARTGGPWWTRFEDPRLDSLIVESLAHNYDLRAAAERVDQAAALARIEGADLWPHLDLGATGRRQKQNFIGFPIPGGDGEVLSSTTTSLGLSAGASWEIDLWGRIRAARSAALADLQGSAAEVAGAELSLAARTARSYFAVAEARQQARLAAEAVESYRQSAETVRERFERGIRTSLDLRLALAQLAEAEAARELRDQNLDRAIRGLEVLLGRYPAAALEVEDPLPPLPGPVPAGLPGDLVARRPDLAAAERRLAAADRRVAEARRSLYPRLSLTGSAGTASTELEDLVDSDFSVWSLVGNLFQPLFQGGRLRAGVALNRSRYEAALFGFASTALAAYAEVENALAAETFLTRREAALAVSAEHAEGARTLAEDQYRLGVVDYITVLESQRRALNARSELIRVRRQRLDSRIDLHLALGGGFHVTQLPGATTPVAAPDEEADS